jgi:MSHA pilin protein MshD
MSCNASRRSRRRSSWAAFTLVEAVVSMLVVGVMMVAVLGTVGASSRGLQSMQERGKGALLARQLMSEIMVQYYEEPLDTVIFGKESGESGSSRAGYDDVDDYNGWSASPPQNKDGTVIPNLDGWARRVAVEWAVSADLAQKAASDTGIKRITVTVTYNDVEVASVVAGDRVSILVAAARCTSSSLARR